jgi:xanthine dehydrogenase accessory factor
MSLFSQNLVLLKGASDLGTGVAWRLRRVGFPVVIAELAQPLVVRRAVAFASAVYDREITIEGITARRVESVDRVHRYLDDGMIPVLIDPEALERETLKPLIVIDSIMAKRNTGTQINHAPFVLALGPGFTPTVDCHAVIETQRGHDLGRVWWNRAAEPNSGVPGEIGGKTSDRILRAPCDGTMQALRAIGDTVNEGEVIARVGEGEVRALITGILRGMIHDGLSVQTGMKIGDIDPRAKRENCFTLSDKSLAVGGGALEAILTWMRRDYRRRDVRPRRQIAR